MNSIDEMEKKVTTTETYLDRKQIKSTDSIVVNNPYFEYVPIYIYKCSIATAAAAVASLYYMQLTSVVV